MIKKLENMFGNVFKKHPVISTIVAVKAVDFAVMGAAYAIWPEETRQVVHQAYNIVKASVPFVAISVANWPNEVVSVC